MQLREDVKDLTIDVENHQKAVQQLTDHVFELESQRVQLETDLAAAEAAKRILQRDVEKVRDVSPLLCALGVVGGCSAACAIAIVVKLVTETRLRLCLFRRCVGQSSVLSMCRAIVCFVDVSGNPGARRSRASAHADRGKGNRDCCAAEEGCP